MSSQKQFSSTRSSTIAIIAMVLSLTTSLAKAAVYGDLNGDGQVSVAEVTTILRTAVGLTTSNVATGDFTGDGKVTVADATAALRTAIKLIPTRTMPSSTPVKPSLTAKLTPNRIGITVSFNAPGATGVSLYRENGSFIGSFSPSGTFTDFGSNNAGLPAGTYGYYAEANGPGTYVRSDVARETIQEANQLTLNASYNILARNATVTAIVKSTTGISGVILYRNGSQLGIQGLTGGNTVTFTDLGPFTGFSCDILDFDNTVIDFGYLKFEQSF